ncbi:glycosyltransferase family 4 protein [Crenobacter luteus]|uniref:Glycosyl transferase family 1 n=1 Tax=Crenobacter luteus TaxID=1452487 RepID=A0A163C730_9NEIS|nr:glycosyltransferase family 4 protein [Crenobacter luteus]KZE30266.1 glycosyl transferase family 1 [Crenobacter luteus]
MSQPVLDRLLVVGSASVHTWRFMAGIAPHAKELYLASNGEPPPELRPAKLAGICKLDFSLKALGSAARLAGFIDAIKPGLVHVHQANSVAWHALRALRGRAIPSVLTAWGSDVLLLPGQNALMRRMVSANLSAASALTADSFHLAARMRELAPSAAGIDIVYFGIDALPPAPAPGRPKKALSCRLHKPLYRIDAILDAWAAVEANPALADWSLTVAASGPETEALKAQAARLKLQRVEFAGFVNSQRLAELYAESRVFVSVPESDATSVSLLEAMGHGCLPVLSNLPANAEWVLDGVNGRIAADIATLPAVLAEALAWAGDDAALAEPVAINRRLVEARALASANTARYVALYRKLLSRPA